MALDLSALDQQPEASIVAEGAARAPLAMFEEDPDNPRFEHDEAAFRALVESVRIHGILQPVIVRRTAAGKLRIRFGARRLRSAQVLGLADIPYVVTEDERQFDDYAQVAENEQRAPLQPLELATFIAKRLAAGETKRVVARRLGKDPSALTHLLVLVGDPPAFLLGLYHEQRCRSPQYLYELRRLHEQDPVAVESACEGDVVIDRPFIAALTARLSVKGQTHDSLCPGSVAPAVVAEGETDVAPALPTNRDCSQAVNAQLEAPTTEKRNAPEPSRAGPGARGGVIVRLSATVEGRPVTVELSQRASAPDCLVVSGADGVRREVAVGVLRLTAVHYAE